MAGEKFYVINNKGVSHMVAAAATRTALELGSLDNVVFENLDITDGFSASAIADDRGAPSSAIDLTVGQLLGAGGSSATLDWLALDLIGAWTLNGSPLGSGGSLTATYVGYGNGSNVLTGEAAFSYNAGTNTLSVVNISSSEIVLSGYLRAPAGVLTDFIANDDAAPFSAIILNSGDMTLSDGSTSTLNWITRTLSGAWALGTPASVTLTNATGLPISGLTASTSTAIGVGSIELGHATDTTLARVAAGRASIEGHEIATLDQTQTFTGVKTFTTPVLGAATGMSLDVPILNPSGNVIEQRNGTNNQELKVYNTYSGGGANYEYFSLRWVSNTMFMSAEKAGTGSNRAISISSGSAVNLQSSGTTVLAITAGAAAVTGTIAVTGAIIATPEALAPALNAGAAVSVSTTSSGLAINGTNALTLANGTNGQIKTIACTAVTAAGTATLTPTTANGFTTVAFTAAGQSLTLQYFTTGGWIIISVRGATPA